MAEILRYISPGGSQILFDDFEDESEYANFGAWVYMCPDCYDKYSHLIGSNASPAPVEGLYCSVLGCKNRNAEYLIDFFPRRDRWDIYETKEGE